jgi:hypothetical protein
LFSLFGFQQLLAAVLIHSQPMRKNVWPGHYQLETGLLNLGSLKTATAVSLDDAGAEFEWTCRSTMPENLLETLPGRPLPRNPA